MWRVDDCFTHGCVFCYWMCRSDVSVIPFRMCLFFIIVFGPVVMNFYKFFYSDDKWNCQSVIGLR